MTALSALQRPGRLVAFSDGVVAIAITVLILPLTDISLDELGPDPIPTLFDRYSFLMISFCISWLVIISFWFVHHRMFELIGSVDRRLMRLCALWLFGVAVFPFPASLIGQNPGDLNAARIVFTFYVGTLVFISLTLALIARHIRTHPQLLNSDGRKVLATFYTTRGWIVCGIFLAALLAGQIWPSQAPLLLFLLLFVEKLSAPLDRRFYPNPPAAPPA